MTFALARLGLWCHLLLSEVTIYSLCCKSTYTYIGLHATYRTRDHIAHLRQQCHNSKSAIFREKIVKGLKCYNFLWEQRRHNCSPAASFADCVLTLYMLKVHPQTFLSIPITQRCPTLSCDNLVANERYVIKKKKIHFRNVYIYISPKLLTSFSRGLYLADSNQSKLLSRRNERLFWDYSEVGEEDLGRNYRTSIPVCTASYPLPG
jgi:hypothetical protein